jgi:hypothetical protein
MKRHEFVDDPERALAARETSCAAKVVRYVVLPAIAFALIVNSRDIAKYLKLVAMSAGAGRQREPS